MPPRPLTAAPPAQVLDGNLTVAQHTQLVLTLLRGLCSHNHLCCDLASQLLLMIVEDHSIKAEQVGTEPRLQATFCRPPHGSRGTR